MTITVNIKYSIVYINGKCASFTRAGLIKNDYKGESLTNKQEIIEVLKDHYEGQEIEFEFIKDTFYRIDKWTSDTNSITGYKRFLPGALNFVSLLEQTDKLDNYPHTIIQSFISDEGNANGWENQIGEPETIGVWA